MFKNVILFITFSILLNWVINLQFLSHSTQEKNTKIIAISLALIIGTAAGFVLGLSFL